MKRSILQKCVTYVFLAASLFVFSTESDGQTRKERDKAEQIVEDGDRWYLQKNYRQAADMYAQALAIVPNNPRTHFRKGLSHYYLKEYALALPELDLALSQGHKNSLEIYLVRWRVHFENKNYDAALEDLKKGSALSPENDDFRVAMGDIYFGKAAYTEALDQYTKALVKMPLNGELHYALARTHAALGNWDAQAAAAEAAIKNRTQSLGDSYRLLGDARQKQRRFPEATDAYLRALSAKPDTYEAYRNLGEIYRSENRINDAIEISRKGLRVFPNDGNFYTDLSWYYSLADRNQDAIDAALAGVKLLPNQYMAYTNLCRAYNDKDRPEMAIPQCNKALALNPNDGETNFYLGRANDLAGKRDEATKYYKSAVTGLLTFTANNPYYSDGFYLLGNAYFADNQREKAIEAYRKCLELNPRFVKARYNIGIIQVLENNRAGAMEQYNSLLTVDRNLAGKLKSEIDKL